MVLGLARGLVRGGAAWAIGYVLALVLVGGGVVDRPGNTLRAAAGAYVDAHVLPGGSLEPTFLVVLPVAVVGVAGYRAGRATRTGVVGRLRAFVQSVRGTERNRLSTATTAAGLLAGGYALAAVVVALLAGASVANALVGGLVYGLVLGVPAAVVGALY